MPSTCKLKITIKLIIINKINKFQPNAVQEVNASVTPPHVTARRNAQRAANVIHAVVRIAVVRRQQNKM
jgi:hypothetical protein